MTQLVLLALPLDECNVATFSFGSAGAEGTTAISVVLPVSSDSSFKYNRDGSLSSNTSDATLLPSSPFFLPKLMSNGTSSSSSTVVAGMTVFNGAPSLSLSNNPIYCGSYSRSRREDLAASSSVTVFASPLVKITVTVLVRPTRVLDERERDSPIPPKLDSEGDGFRSGKFEW